MYSGYSSVASFSSVASSSTASSRRMIIPLYNLQAHNVMTNIIVDAGTDAKVAKFQKTRPGDCRARYSRTHRGIRFQPGHCHPDSFTE
ncbi:hypothetical protein BGW80DRAFT_1402645 [Lactifluus volemus]|nr:hypothetical protein BGW80DRAFT_1402645 [Lactifluus volemus]